MNPFTKALLQALSPAFPQGKQGPRSRVLAFDESYPLLPITPSEAGDYPEQRLSSYLGGPIVGVDEVGRGPWAGPVVCAAVALDFNRLLEGICDSKKLSPARRAVLGEQLRATACFALGESSAEEIDRINIRQATLQAMRRAVEALPIQPAAILIDGHDCPEGLSAPAVGILKGDSLILSIAAASILAKTARDAFMQVLAKDYPDYGFERHKGYGTVQHAAALARYGPTPHHRYSFRPVQAWREGPSS